MNPTMESERSMVPFGLDTEVLSSGDRDHAFVQDLACVCEVNVLCHRGRQSSVSEGLSILIHGFLADAVDAL